MGPHNNAELFENYGAPHLSAIDKETDRRELLSKAVAELSQLLDGVDEPYCGITEPTLLPRLFALLQLKYTPASIAGFYEMSPRILAAENEVLLAKAAPYHDEVPSEDGSKLYRTRIIQLKVANPEKTDLEFFGINMYQHQDSIQVAGLEGSKQVDPATDAYLALRKNSPAKNHEPITGQTVLVIARNTKTNDAKVYSIKLVARKGDDSGEFESGETGTIDTECVAEDKGFVEINGNRILVEVLSGHMLHQAVFEIHTACQKLREPRASEKISTQKD